MLRLLAYVLPLSLDSFAVAAALGARPLTSSQRRRISAMIVAFETGMPIVGALIGRPLANAIGAAAAYVAGAVLIGIGLWMTMSGDDDDEAGRLVTATGWIALGVGLAVSVDELAIGFTLGLTGLSLPVVVIAIGIQAVIATQLGLAIGARLGEAWREWAERVAGMALAALGVWTIVEQLVRH